MADETLIDDATLRRLNDGKAATAVAQRSERHIVGAPPHRQLVERYVLGNGLRVVLWPDAKAPVFSYHTWFEVGSRREEDGLTGMAHLFEHLMFKATKNLGDGEFDQIMERHGAQTNAATWVDWTYYREKLPAGNLELCCRLEADRMEHMVLNEAQLASEREVVKNERLMRVDNDPDGTLYETLYATAFTTHGYRTPTIGWMRDIEAITLQDCLDFYRRFYAPNNATIVIVGDIDAADALGLIQRYYGHLQAGEIPAEVTKVEPPQREERRVTLHLPVAVPRAVYAFHAPAGGDPAHAALEVLNEILVGGESSLLYRRLVTEQEIASDVGGWTASWREPGVYEISVTLHAGQTVEAAEVVLDGVIAEVVDNLVSPRELEKAVNGLEAGTLRSAAATGSRARGLGHAEATIGDFRWYFSHREAFRSVTAADIRAVARRVLARTNRTVVTVLPAPQAADDAAPAPTAAQVPA